jgi:hypothetical protein
VNRFGAMAWVLGTGAICACASPEPRTPPDGADWRAARSELSELRRALAPKEPYTMRLALDMREPRALSARGAIAVRPPDALRMIMLGPGGTTAFDLWICGDRFKLSIPAADVERRGDRDTPTSELRGLPVAFLRWWLLQPLAGRLVNHETDDEAQRFDLRDGAALTRVSLPADRWPLAIERGDESMIISSEGCAEVSYQRAGAIALTVRCEALEASPRAEAFVDPDDPSRPCGVAR